MAVPTVHNVGTINKTSTGAVSPGLPTVSANEVVLIFATVAPAQTLSITADGSITPWTLVTGMPAAGQATPDKLYVWWGRYTSGATGPTITPSATTDHEIIQLISCSGVGTVGDPVNVTAKGSQGSGTALSFATGVSTTLPDCLVFLAATVVRDFTTANWASEANTSLTNLVEQVDASTNTGTGSNLLVESASKATAGTLGTWTATSTSTSAMNYMTLALQAANTYTKTGFGTENRVA